MTEVRSIGGRLDALPKSWPVWRLIVLVSLGGFFEFYDLMMTAYISPGLTRAGIFHAGEKGLLCISDQGVFAAATFLGLFIGTAAFAGVADRLGRRFIFTASLLWYTGASAMMAFASSAATIDFWRLVAGVGIGIELVTIDAYIAEWTPPAIRGRAFAVNQAIQFLAVPIVALACWLLVPKAPLGVAGWRWVILAGSTGALAVWFIRRGLPESPRWLEARGRVAEAERILARFEPRTVAPARRDRPTEGGRQAPAPSGGISILFSPEYRRRTIILIVFNVFQAIGFYGFGNWAPSLIAAQGHTVIDGLGYSFAIAIAWPLGPLLCAAFADRIERKVQIVLSALATACLGLLFARQSAPVALIALGVAITLSNTLLSYSYHAYQTELFPTRVRATAVGFVYSWSRLSTVCSSLLIALLLARAGSGAVFALIAGAMGVVIVSVGVFGPRTNGAGLEDISP